MVFRTDEPLPVSGHEVPEVEPPARVQMGVEIMLEPYASWYREQDLGPMYRYYRDLLCLLDWQRPGERWLLKAPAHMWAIEPLLDCFPDVSIVWSHRDPLLCTASICSMTHALADGLAIDKTVLGPIVMDFYATSLERGLAARDRAGAASFVDVTHDEFVDDSLAVIELRAASTPTSSQSKLLITAWKRRA